MHNCAQYLQLEAERNSKHLKPLHLKVYTNGSFVIFVKDIFAKSEAHTQVKTLLNESIIIHITLHHILHVNIIL